MGDLHTPDTFLVYTFVAKMSAEDGSFLWSRAIGGASGSEGGSIDVDGSLNAYADGYGGAVNGAGTAAGLPQARLRLAPNGLDVSRFRPASVMKRWSLDVASAGLAAVSGGAGGS